MANRTVNLQYLAGAEPIARARAMLRARAVSVVDEMRELVAVPAPPFGEARRSAWFATRLQEAGYAPVCDELHNVIAAHGSLDGCLVLAAHLDTVFPEDTPLTPRERDGRIYAPGISDNVRGLAAILALARVLAEVDLGLPRTVAFVGTVGEEAAGDLRGMKHLFREGGPLRNAAAVIAVDGSGLRRIVHRAVGSIRMRVTVRGSGGHSWADYGIPNPLHALTAAMARLASMPLPSRPRTTLTVARMQGGTSINAIPAEAWAEIDIRSEDAAVLRRLDEAVHTVLTEETRAARVGRHGLEVDSQRIGERPAGVTAADHPLVRVARAATRMIGERPELIASSTDANVPISLGIPGIAIGAGGESGGMHTLEEWYSDEGGAEGLERLLLTVAGAASAL
jgi:tripeptide aminopeptidase